MSEAERDIEDILDGQNIQPNRLANAAYKQRFVDYMLDHEEDMDQEQVARMLRYMRSLDEVILSNTRRAAREQAQKELKEQTVGGQGAARPRAPGPAQPFQDVMQQNVST